MEISTATATEMQNNFGKYLSLVMTGQEVIVTRNGKVSPSRQNRQEKG